MKRHFHTYVLVWEGLSTGAIEVARGTVYQEIRPRAAFRTDDFVN